MLSLIFIALSLSLDAFAVSVCSGISMRNSLRFYAVRASFFFGLFQFLMPLAGWYLGGTFSSYIEAYDHWIAFGLLAFVGGKMLKESRAIQKEESKKYADIRNLKVLFTLALATSIDALAVGLSFKLLERPIWGFAAFIGAVTFVVCLVGFEFGKRIGFLFKKWAQIAGGLILIGLGITILIDHLL
ncbi:MAG: manganese efflux pump MntP family protein [Spirochaetaceae bacterium]|jgi:putative Mn2+ efflux pump MntP|nr:manganese efflux pump MntP family protein [Spirochaetaceae bacterium]